MSHAIRLPDLVCVKSWSRNQRLSIICGANYQSGDFQKSDCENLVHSALQFNPGRRPSREPV